MTLVKIDRIGTRGDGMGVDDGKTVIVGKTLPSETVELVGGKLKRIVTPSADRIAAFCKFYDSCGGCKFQHWAHEPYVAWKRQLVVDALKSQGLDVEVGLMIDAHGLGRRRVSLHVRQIEDVWHAGFMEAKTHDLVAIDVCPVLDPKLYEAFAIAAAFGPLMGACDVAITAADNGLDVSIKAEREAVAKRISAFNELMSKFNIARVSVNNLVAAFPW
jgi:23S rRNA (uracil1939-C5)-methyltransferase